MRTKNYLTLKENNVVQLHGFDYVTDYVYVEVFAKRNTLVLMTSERPEWKNCFRLNVESDRTVTSARLTELINIFNLNAKRFLADEDLKNYVSTDIDA